MAINESWEGRDLAGFIKTTLAQQNQKSQIGQFNNTYGASSLLSNVSKKTSDENKAKIADGIDMGNQVPKGIIPIIYGHIGMSNTQFDDGQQPSSVDAEVVVQSVKMPISEGPIIGSARLDNNNAMSIFTPANAVDHLKNVIINDSYVIDPTTNVANFKDVKFEMTYGDGTLDKQESTLLETNPLLDNDIEALDDPINDKALNDLSDVNAGKGVNYVLYWNTTEGKWEAKSFNTLLNEAGATYNGGAGGDGGTGGTGGDGGTGGTGGVGPSDGSGLKYTQWNPPPTHVETTGTTKTETTITPPPTTPAIIVTGKGAPLREDDETTPYFQSLIDFADVDQSIDDIKLHFFFPDGIYREIITETTVIDGTITLCGSQRPDLEGEDSGDLDCLTPSVRIADDGQSSTTKTRTTASVKIYYTLTTELCGREFILTEDAFTLTHLKNGPYRHELSVPLIHMNAGNGTKSPGSQQIGSLVGFGDCNSDDPEYYNFKDWTLSDYLQAYPDQIVNAANTVKVYAWVDEDVNSEEKTISTNTYLEKVSVCSDLDGYVNYNYLPGQTSASPFFQHAPDHGFNYTPHVAETGVEPYQLLEKRCEQEITTGAFSIVKNPDPLLVWDYSTMGEPGAIGNAGYGGSAGDSGSAGTSGTVSVPNLEPIPSVEGKDASYPGDGTASTITLPTIKVFNDDPAATNLLTIAVSSGTTDVVSIPAGVTVQDRNTNSLKIQGAIADIQTCLDSGITYTSTTATLGDVAVALTISSSAGSSLDNRTIRSAAVTNYVAPTFEIIVMNYVGTFDAYVRGKAIMNSITGATSNDATATIIANAITSYTSIPNWTATANNNVVTVTGEAGLGASYNGIQPTYTGTMGAQISLISGGVSPSKQTQPVRNAGNLKARFIPATAFTNTLDDTEVAYAQVAYRPPQGDGQTTLSEVGFMVGGKLLEAAVGLSFSAWQSAGYTSTPAWSNNPAWVFFDYLTNTTYGLGNEIILDTQQKEDLYYDIYNFSSWCGQHQQGDDIVDCNAIIYGAESKIEVLQKIASTGNGKFVYLNGNPRLIFDGWAFEFTYQGVTFTPTVKKVVNQTSAGNMVYQSGSIDNLYNVINVKFANSDNFYRLEEVQYRNASSIATFGERETTIDAWGITDKQQALWQGAWTYETESANSEIVTYIAGWDHFDVLPGDLICLNDALRVDSTTAGGRVISDNGDGTLTLDRTGGSGNVAIADINGVVQYGTVSGTTATISGSFQANAVWNVYSGTTAQNYRVVAIEESEDGIYAVTAQKHDPDKYSRVWANTI